MLTPWLLATFLGPDRTLSYPLVFVVSQPNVEDMVYFNCSSFITSQTKSGPTTL